jgi:hypothetical protein
VVTRGTVLGRNAIDLEITNTSATEQTIEIAAGPPLVLEQEDMGAELPVVGGQQDMEVIGEDMGEDDPLNPALDDLRGLIARRQYLLAAGQSAKARIVPNELGRQANVLLRVSCAGEGCSAKMKYLVVVAPLECSEDGDCEGALLCDTLRGQCVECRGDSDCLQGQRCELARCTPPQVSGCQGGPPSSGGFGAAWLWAVCVAGAWWARRRRRRAASVGMGAALCVALSPQAEAQEVRASFGVGPGMYGLTGELGEQSNSGLGLALVQQLRGRYVGAGLELTAVYFTTNPTGVALSRELVLYSALVGPRAYLPTGPVEVVVGGGYERMGLASNSLVELTGVRGGYHGAAGWAGLRYVRSLALVEARGGYHWYAGLPGGMWSAVVMVGVSD